ncbi:exodeoxyribonuclease VII small subunit [Bacteroidota bacterium]
MPKKKKSFEDKMNRLDEIVNILDQGDAPLDDLLKIFEEGMKLAAEMRVFLDKAKQKVIDITKKNKIVDDEYDENSNFDNEN